MAHLHERMKPHKYIRKMCKEKSNQTHELKQRKPVDQPSHKSWQNHNYPNKNHLYKAQKLKAH